MKKTSFMLADIADTPHILPYGQAIADYRHGTLTNETGACIWDMLKNGLTREDILTFFKDSYEADQAMMADISSDIDSFIAYLDSHDILSDDITYGGPEYNKHHVNIAGLGMSMYVPDRIIAEYFADFTTDGDALPLQQIILYPHAPVKHPNGLVLVRNDEMIVIDADRHYIFLPLKSKYVHEMHVSKDACNVYVYSDYVSESECISDIFNILRFSFSMLALKNDLLLVHSASVLYKGKALLFSGHSGAGKSTHTGLWADTFATDILNGDLNIIGIKNGSLMCLGLPWCGTSGTYTKDDYPLAAITYLNKADYNKTLSLSDPDKSLRLLQRLISPTYTEEELSKCIALVSSFSKMLPAFSLFCTKEKEAAIVMKQAIDKL